MAVKKTILTGATQAAYVLDGYRVLTTEFRICHNKIVEQEMKFANLSHLTKEKLS
jgi:hypothetical protein